MVMVGAMVVMGGVGCGPKRVRVANTPEGQACRKECNAGFNECFQGKRRNKKICTQRENECLRECPGALTGDEDEQVVSRPPPAPAPVPAAPSASTTAETTPPPPPPPPPAAP